MKDNQFITQFRAPPSTIHEYLNSANEKENHKKNHEKISNNKGNNKTMRRTFRDLDLVNQSAHK